MFNANLSQTIMFAWTRIHTPDNGIKLNEKSIYMYSTQRVYSHTVRAPLGLCERLSRTHHYQIDNHNENSELCCTRFVADWVRNHLHESNEHHHKISALIAWTMRQRAQNSCFRSYNRREQKMTQFRPNIWFTMDMTIAGYVIWSTRSTISSNYNQLTPNMYMIVIYIMQLKLICNLSVA